MTGSPFALPIGTRPEATAPATVPMKNGVSTDESANAPVARRRPRSRARDPLEGEARATQHDPERREAERDEQGRHDRREGLGKAVHSTTSTKISQTWFASQTGPIAQSIRARARLAALAAAGHQRPEAGAEVGAAEHRVERHAGPEHGRDGVGGAHSRLLGAARDVRSRPVGHLALVELGRPPAARHRPQHQDGRGPERPRRATSTTPRLIQTPLASVTASFVRMKP